MRVKSADSMRATLAKIGAGPISDALAAELSKWYEPGVEVIRMPVHEGGFTRTNVR